MRYITVKWVRVFKSRPAQIFVISMHYPFELSCGISSGWTMAIDLYHADRNLKTFVKRVKKSKIISAHNKKIILSFQSRLRIDGVKDKRILRYLYDVEKFAKYFSNLDFEATTKKDVESFLNHFISLKSPATGKPYSERTVYDMKKSLKRFYKWLRNCERDMPQEVSWIKMNTIQKLKITPETVLNVPDMNSMVQAGKDVRDKLLASLLFTSGMRVSEVAGIKIGHIDFATETIVVSGKTGTRIVPYETHFLKEYLETYHPRPDDKEAYLWVSVGGKPITSYNWFRQRMVGMAKRAGITKPSSPHCARHACASHSSANGVNEVTQRIIFGWSATSRTPAIYNHMNPNQAINNFKNQVYGSGKAPEPEPMGVKCGCGFVNPIGSVFCKCGEKLKDTSPRTTKVELEQVEKFRSEMISHELLLKLFEVYEPEIRAWVRRLTVEEAKEVKGKVAEIYDFCKDGSKHLSSQSSN